MIALVIGTIILNKWKLTKPLGVTMFVFYFLFVGQVRNTSNPPFLPVQFRPVFIESCLCIFALL